MMRMLIAFWLGGLLLVPTLLRAEPGVSPLVQQSAVPEQKYFDGRHWRSVWLDENEVAELIEDNAASVLHSLAPNAQLLQQGRRFRIWRLDQAMPVQQLTRNLNSVASKRFLPVFRLSAHGGARLVLTGNLVVRFKQPVESSALLSWADTQGLTLLQRMTIPETYLFTVAEGVSVLEKANQIQATGEVRFAVPDWWRPAYKR